MMMAYPHQNPHTHPDPRHLPQHEYPQSLSSSQWVPVPRERFARSGGFYAPSPSQTFASSSSSAHSSSGFFDASAGASSSVAAHVTPARSTLPMPRTLTNEPPSWSPVGDDWSVRGAIDSHDTSMPPPTLTRAHSQTTYDSQYSFPHDSAPLSAWDDGEGKAQHIDPSWPSAPSAHHSEFQLDQRQWRTYASDAPVTDDGSSQQYAPLPHAHSAPFNPQPAFGLGPTQHSPPLASSVRLVRKDRQLPPPRSPPSGWQDGGDSTAPAAFYGASPSPVLSASPAGPISPLLGHGASPRAQPPTSVHVKQEADAAVVEGSSKKKRRRASGKQLETLNSVYSRTAFPSTEERQELAKQLDMTPRSVQIWFQNSRQKQREQRMGSTPLAPNLERVARRGPHSVRGVGSGRRSSLAGADLPSTSDHILTQPSGSGLAPELPASASSASMTGPLIASPPSGSAHDSQLSSRARGRARRLPAQ